MADCIHLVKLCVGADSVGDLETWISERVRSHADGYTRHVTRMWPRRESALVNGGSLYWVIKGVIQARQRIIRLDEVTGDDGVRRCAIVLDPAVIRTGPAPRRPFQGWRYLQPGDTPPDLRRSEGAGDTLPPELSVALAEIGVC